MNVTQKQLDALKKILYTDISYDIDGRTLAALKRKHLINSVCQITEEGILTINPNAPKVEIPAINIEARQVQDELITLICNKRWDLSMRLSRDLPSDITGASLIGVVYPEYVSDFKRMLVQLGNAR